MSNKPSRTPWHVWAVGIVTLLWNAIGANDYTMTQLGNRAYLDAMQYPPAGLAYIQAFPAWAVAGWAFGVWGALLGSVLLLLRRRLALWAFAASLFGMAIVTVYEARTAKPPEVAALQPAWFPIVLWGIAVFLLVYSWSMRRRGVLR
ncbi:hypothetical protein E3U23_06300 [Erythrobacter litoralis]|uniref:hypothetical protein n=1 Tax=Erythrobacter litoralis TaxID=39960 RepID=UPI0024359E4F|nr:hypothetical protein [Erythrobacter litoralis]MDG6078803.1 hypothetical protein [Erythrobacter litoralis]